MNVTFLSAAVPLTKTITMRNGVISKDSYPLLNRFTSNTIVVSTLRKLFEVLKATSTHPAKPCMLKGEIQKELKDESRKQATLTNTATQLVVFDLDRAPFNSPDEFLNAVGLGDVSYVVQYSSSYKLDRNDKTLSCHIFCMLSKPRPAPELKTWLMHLNLSTPVLRSALTLSNSNIALHWPLDITCCQNDKLIYIAEPVFIGMKSPVPAEERIQFIKRSKDTIPVEMIALRAMDALKKEQRALLNDLQKAAGIAPTKVKTKQIGEYEVQTGAGEIAQYEVIDDGEYNRINLNNGDSNAYFHRKDDLTLLHNFKGEPFPYIKDILPHYYADMVRAQNIENATPTEGGEILLAYRDKVTATYHKGTWHPETKCLELHTVKSRDQLIDFMLGHGRDLGKFAPEWHTVFDPKNPVVVDQVNHIVNLFTPSEFMQADNQKKGSFPAIQRLLDSAVGTGEIQAHFINWLAFSFQFKLKPLTAWILHGTFGTGKGMLLSMVLAPIFGQKYVHQMRASELNEKFNGYLETSLIVFIDEIEADMFTNPKGAESDLRNYITEPNITIRRMRTDSYMVPNFTGFIFSSNKKQPVHVPMGDRRYNVGSFQAERYFPSDKEIEAIPKELAAFAHFLQHYKVDKKAARSILQTEEREAIQQLGVTSIDALANDLLTGNLEGLLEALPDTQLMNEMGMQNPTSAAYTNLMRRFATEALGAERLKSAPHSNRFGNSKITRDELAVIFTHCIGKVPEGANKFTVYLRHHGIITKRIRTEEGVTYGLQTDWVISDETKAHIQQLFPNKSTKLKSVK